jgi:hypothetical protein
MAFPSWLKAPALAPLAGMGIAGSAGLLVSLPLISAQLRPAQAQSAQDPEVPAQRAQEPMAFSAIRAINLARSTAVKLNGGLSVYHPANCMFTNSISQNPCLVSSGADGFIYRFLGGPPGWQVLNLPPSTETEIEIAPDGRSVVKVLYNGPPR